MVFLFSESLDITKAKFYHSLDIVTMNWYIAFTNTALIFVSLYIANLLFRAQAELQNRSDERLRQLTHWQALHAIKQHEIPALILKGRELIYILPLNPKYMKDQKLIEWKSEVGEQLHLFIRDWYRVYALCQIDPYKIENYDEIEDDLFASMELLDSQDFPRTEKEYFTCFRVIRSGVDKINQQLQFSLAEEPLFTK